MKEQTLKYLALTMSILTLPILYVATDEKNTLTITGTVMGKKQIKNGEIITVLTPLNVVLYTNTNLQKGQTMHAQGRITPYQDHIEFIAETAQTYD